MWAEYLIGISLDCLCTVVDILTNLHARSIIDVCSFEALIYSELGPFIEQLNDIFAHTVMIFLVDRNTIKDPIHFDREKFIRDRRALKIKILDNTLIFQ